MKKILLPFVVCLLHYFTPNIFALEISIESAKDNFTKYSTLELRNDEHFTCQEIYNSFGETKKVICAFSKKATKPTRELESEYFTIGTFIKKETYFLVVTPKYKIKVFSDVFDLTKDDEVFPIKATLAKHWTFLGYKKTMPLLQQKTPPSKSLNFPFYLDKNKLPFVGSLDLAGNPVYIKKVEDVKEYLRVKKLFKSKNYDLALEAIDDILHRYPHTLFKAELLYYKIKVYMQLKYYDNVIDSAKVYLREYSSAENIPEVLAYIAKAYNEIGQSSDADYFFDRLFSEHPKALYTYWAYIYKGEGLEESGGDKQAEYFYKKALYGTTNVDVAVSAAYHLAHLKLTLNSKQAAKYVEKIIKVKPEYFAHHFKDAKEMMYQFADLGRYKTAADMAETLLSHGINPSYDEYEDILKDWGLWLAQTKEKKKALNVLNKYLKAFPDGDYVDVVQIAKDQLFFELDDLNASARLVQYDTLVQEYGKDTIGQKALYEKAKLLLKLKRYSDVLALQEELLHLSKASFDDVETIIKQAAIGEMQQALAAKECKKVLNISARFEISLSDEWDDGVYECAMEGGDFSLAKKIARKHLQSKVLSQRQKWLYRFVKVDFETGNYSEVVDAAKDLISLVDDIKTSPYKEVYRYLFDAYERLGQNTQMVKTMLVLEKIFGLNYKDLDRYSAMVTLGIKLHDDTLVIKYAKKVLSIEKKTQAYPQTPYVDFALYQVYMDKAQYKRALRVIKALDNVQLSSQQRARQKYLLATVLSKLGNTQAASKAYREAIKADKKSAWAQLARTALEL